MADTKDASTGHTTEATFRAYTSEQGAAYSEARPGYHPNLYKRVIDHHVSTGGQLGTLIDVGCGPGTATRPLAPHFTHAFGLDPSQGMISTARQNGGTTSSGQPIQFECSTAEDLAAGQNLIPDGTADLIVAATAAHWFDIAKFWPRAAKILRPGGTVAFWTTSSMQAHPSVPNAEKINAAMAELREREMMPYIENGNRINRSLYTEMFPLPWECDPQVPEFEQSTFVRKEWGTPNNDDAEVEGGELFINGQREVSLDLMEKMMVTGSPVHRWQQANPDKVGTDQDIVKLMRNRIAKLLHEAGVPEGKETLKGNICGVLIMVKKKA
ncbi:hypothetical protein N7474_001418 [Penicillium riverlandense]|uniref:uncharacterized protein n=1 Tax=Penicillium riverlandense TaxID=1903569 RepID=UPI002546F783|nr:uncharacterized protein N7474_001418 [Penicillium riverlandense]KAJ5833107.1 hypothetical protein N7474_001418 [Penicillium riverlandense]